MLAVACWAGRIDAGTATAMLGQGSATATEQGPMAKVEGKSGSDIADIQLRMFPTISSRRRRQWKPAGDHHLLPALWAVHRQARTCDARCTTSFWDSSRAMLKLTEFIIRFAPIGVFGLATLSSAAPVKALFGAI